MKLTGSASHRLAAGSVATLLLAALSACGEGDSGSPGGAASGSGGSAGGSGGETGDRVVLNGAVQKGPFVLGTSVAASLLDAALEPTGQVFNTQTENDLGEFEIGFPAGSPVSLEGQGFYYNEVTAALSQGNLTLRALYVPEQTGTQSAYINMVTHLTYGRVEALVAGGAAFADAVAQAEDELVSELALTPEGFSPGKAGIDMNLLGGDDDANAYLLAVSAVLAQAGYERDPSSPDAELQALLNSISNDLSEDGALLEATSDKVTAGLAALDPEAVMQGLADRLMDVGSSAEVPDVNRVLDQDRDGLTNTDDNCPLDVNPDQEDGDGDGYGDVCDECPETACDARCAPAAENGSSVDFCFAECVVQGSDIGCEAADQACVWDVQADAVCVPTCDPLAEEPCPTGQTCNQLEPSHCLPGDPCGRQTNQNGPEEVVWVCVPELTGAAAEGETCEPEAGSCQAGLTCARDLAWCGAEYSFCCARVCDEGANDACGPDVDCEPFDEEAGVGICATLSGLGEPCAYNGEGCQPEFYCSPQFLPEQCPDAIEGCCLQRCTLPDGDECEASEQCVELPEGGGFCQTG